MSYNPNSFSSPPRSNQFQQLQDYHPQPQQQQQLQNQYQSQLRQQTIESHRVNISPNKIAMSRLQGNTDAAYLQVNPRIRYLRKLYLAVFIQLALAVGLCAWVIFDDDFRSHLNNNPVYFWVSLSGTVLIALFGLCYRNRIRQSPINLICFILWTIFFDAFIVQLISLPDSKSAPFMALILLASLVLGQFFYTLTVRYELTIQGSTLFVFGVSLIVFHIFTLFSDLSFFKMLGISFLGVLFAFYLIFDTQSRLAAPDYDFNKEEWKSGAVLVYLDIFLLFLRISDLLKTTIDKKSL